jgi:hypothetical protein
VLPPASVGERREMSRETLDRDDDTEDIAASLPFPPEKTEVPPSDCSVTASGAVARPGNHRPDERRLPSLIAMNRSTSSTCENFAAVDSCERSRSMSRYPSEQDSTRLKVSILPFSNITWG